MLSTPDDHTGWPCRPEYLVQAGEQQQQYSPLEEPRAGSEHCMNQVAGELQDHNEADTQQEGGESMHLEHPRRMTQLCAMALEQGAENEAVIVQQVGGLLCFKIAFCSVALSSKIIRCMSLSMQIDNTDAGENNANNNATGIHSTGEDGPLVQAVLEALSVLTLQPFAAR